MLQRYHKQSFLLFLAILAGIGLSTLSTMSALAQSRPTRSAQDHACTQVLSSQVNSNLRQGLVGRFIIDNTCTDAVSGLLQLGADISNCISAPPIGTYTQKYLLYILPPESRQLFLFSIGASCINCNCDINSPARSTGFNLIVDLYNGEGIQNPVDMNLNLLTPVILHAGYHMGGTILIGTCGADVVIDTFRPINVI